MASSKKSKKIDGSSGKRKKRRVKTVSSAIMNAIESHPDGRGVFTLALMHPEFSQSIGRLATEQSLRQPLIQRQSFMRLQRTCNSPDEYQQALLKAGRTITSNALNLLLMPETEFVNGCDMRKWHITRAHTQERPTIYSKLELQPKSVSSFQVDAVDLVEASTEELTAKSTPATFPEIFAGIKEVGLSLCPAWVGPEYYLGCDTFITCDHLMIGMMPLVATNVIHPDLFVIKHNSSKHLELGACGVSEHRHGLYGLKYFEFTYPPTRRWLLCKVA